MGVLETKTIECPECLGTGKTCLLLQRVRSLTVTPHVYSQVHYEVLMSYTDIVKVQILIQTTKHNNGNY